MLRTESFQHPLDITRHSANYAVIKSDDDEILSGWFHTGGYSGQKTREIKGHVNRFVPQKMYKAVR